MDNLTHTLTALALSRAGLDRLSPRAGWILALSANLADLDAVSALAGGIAYLDYHRHFTHSLLFVPVAALLSFLAVRLLFRKRLDWRRAGLLALIGAASHPPLDWMNAYGARLLWPFSGEWFQADLFYVVDLWVWLVFLAAFAGPFLSRLVSSEIGARARPGRGWAIFALSFLLLYGFGRHLLHQRAVAMLEARIYQGEAPSRVAALPTPANPLRWTGVVETPEFYMLHSINLAGEFDPTLGQVLHKPAASPPLEAARGAGFFQGYLRFARFPHWRVSPPDGAEGGYLVQAMDLRFGTPSAPRFVANALVDESGRVKRTWFDFRPAGSSPGP